MHGYLTLHDCLKKISNTVWNSAKKNFKELYVQFLLNFVVIFSFCQTLMVFGTIFHYLLYNSIPCQWPWSMLLLLLVFGGLKMHYTSFVRWKPLFIVVFCMYSAITYGSILSFSCSTTGRFRLSIHFMHVWLFCCWHIVYSFTRISNKNERKEDITASLWICWWCYPSPSCLSPFSWLRKAAATLTPVTQSTTSTPLSLTLPLSCEASPAFCTHASLLSATSGDFRSLLWLVACVAAGLSWHLLCAVTSCVF